MTAKSRERQSEADARAQLLEVIERAGLELIRTAGVARAIVCAEKTETISGDVLDVLQGIADHATRAILQYRQFHEIETGPA